MLKDGKPDESLFLSDRTHLNLKAYQLITPLVDSVFRKNKFPIKAKLFINFVSKK